MDSSSTGKTAYGFDFLLSTSASSASVASQGIWLPGWLEAINNDTN